MYSVTPCTSGTWICAVVTSRPFNALLYKFNELILHGDVLLDLIFQRQGFVLFLWSYD
jgi:hypothetical protein